MPSMSASADELQRRMHSARDRKKRPRLPALSLAASGQARHRQESAARLGVHRHSVAAWLRADTEGGCDHALRSQRPLPPGHQRIPAAALAALQDTRQAPHGVASSHQRRVWWADEPQGALASARVQALGRDQRHAQPKRPRPSHPKKP